MKEEHRNVVQTEFKLHTLEPKSFEALFEECNQRSQDAHLALQRTGRNLGTGISIVLRFYDSGNRLTAFTRWVEELSHEKNSSLKKIGDAMQKDEPIQRIRCTVHYRLFTRASRKLRGARRKGVKLASTRVKEALCNKEDVVVDQSDDTLRFVRKDEEHELLESIQNASMVWLFVYEPGPLLRQEGDILHAAIPL